MTEESKLLGKKGCPDCGSSDARAYYEDGHEWCYVCDELKVKPNMATKDRDNNDDSDIDDDSNNSDLPDISGTCVGPISDRNISKEAVRFYGVKLSLHNGVPNRHYYPYFNRDGKLIGYKVREIPKKLWTEGDLKRGTLFGQNKFTKEGKYVTVTEGELDCLAVYQMLGSKWPVVSVRSGAAGAYRDCKTNFEWLDSYDTIVFAFDADEAGQKAAAKCASLFPKKSKLVKLNKKDPCKYLEENKNKEFVAAWWDAEQYKPDDIVFGQDMWEVINQERQKSVFEYPWTGLNNLTYGGRTGEMIIITAGSGMGKTQILREISYHIHKTTDLNQGLIYLEETGWETGRGIMSVDMSKPLHLPDTHYTKQEMASSFDSTWGTNRLFTLNDRWRDNELDYICDKIKFLAKGCDCKVIILDHISFMVSDQAGDERKMLDEIAHRLKALTIELDIHLCAVCHSKRQTTKPLEEGGATSLSDLRGTAGIGQLANIVLGLERNGQADDEKERNTTLIRVLKNRFSGATGPTSRLYYDKNTGRLDELEEEIEETEGE